jgi:hypothetical protein
MAAVDRKVQKLQGTCSHVNKTCYTPWLLLSSMLFAELACLIAVASAREIPVYIPPDPYADPANDRLNPLRYIASNALTGVALGES